MPGQKKGTSNMIKSGMFGRKAGGAIDVTPDAVRCECDHTRSDHTFQVVDCPGPDLCDGALEPNPADHGTHVASPCTICACTDLEPIAADHHLIEKALRGVQKLGVQTMPSVPKKDPKNCDWCETGEYQGGPLKDRSDLANSGLGLNIVGDSKGFTLFECNNCGHLQLFRTKVGTPSEP